MRTVMCDLINMLWRLVNVATDRESFSFHMVLLTCNGVDFVVVAVRFLETI